MLLGPGLQVLLASPSQEAKVLVIAAKDIPGESRHQAKATATEAPESREQALGRLWLLGGWTPATLPWRAST